MSTRIENEMKNKYEKEMLVLNKTVAETKRTVAEKERKLEKVTKEKVELSRCLLQLKLKDDMHAKKETQIEIGKDLEVIGKNLDVIDSETEELIYKGTTQNMYGILVKNKADQLGKQCEKEVDDFEEIESVASEVMDEEPIQQTYAVSVEQEIDKLGEKIEKEIMNDLKEIKPVAAVMDKETMQQMYAASVEKEIEKLSKKYERDMSAIVKKLEQLERNELMYKEMFQSICREKAVETCNSLIPDEKVSNLKQSLRTKTKTKEIVNDTGLDSDCSITSEYVAKILKSSQSNSNLLTDINTDIEGTSLSCNKVADTDQYLNLDKILLEMKTIPSILYPMELTDNEATINTERNAQVPTNHGSHNRTKYSRRLKFELNRQKSQMFSSTSESETSENFRRRRKRIRRNLSRKGEISETSDNGTDTPESSFESNLANKPILEKENIYEIEQKSVDSGCAVSDSDIIEMKLTENVSCFTPVNVVKQEKFKILENIIISKPISFVEKTSSESRTDSIIKNLLINGDILLNGSKFNVSCETKSLPDIPSITPISETKSGNLSIITTEETVEPVEQIVPQSPVSLREEYSVNEQLNKIHALTTIFLSFLAPYKTNLMCIENTIISEQKPVYDVQELLKRINILTPILLSYVAVDEDANEKSLQITDIDEISTNTNEIIENIDDYKEILNDSILSNFDSIKECVAIPTKKRPFSSCIETKAKKQKTSISEPPNECKIISLNAFESFVANYNIGNLNSNSETIETSLLGVLEEKQKSPKQNIEACEGTNKIDKNTNEVLFKISQDLEYDPEDDVPLSMYRKKTIKTENILETIKKEKTTNRRSSCRKAASSKILRVGSQNVETKRKYDKIKLFGSDSDSTYTSPRRRIKRIARTKTDNAIKTNSLSKKNALPRKIVPKNKIVSRSKIILAVETPKNTDKRQFKRPSLRKRIVDTIQSPPHETSYEVPTENIKIIPLERIAPISFGKYFL